MPYYNCFNAREISDVYLNSPTTSLLHPSNDLFPDYSLHPGMLRTTAYDSSKDTYTLGYNNAYRVVAVPIKFGKHTSPHRKCDSYVSIAIERADKSHKQEGARCLKAMVTV